MGLKTESRCLTLEVTQIHNSEVLIYKILKGFWQADTWEPAVTPSIWYEADMKL